MVLAWLCAASPATLAALPVGASSRKGLPYCSISLTKAAMRVVFPVPANPLSMRQGYETLVSRKSTMRAKANR